MVQLLLEHPEVDPNIAYTKGYTPLWWSCYRGSSEIVQLLWDRKDIDLSRLCFRRRPLTAAAEQRHEMIVRMIVRMLLAREDMNVDPENEHVIATLAYATCSGHTKVLQLLIEHWQIPVGDYRLYGGTFLFWAANEGNASIVQMLLGYSDVDPNGRLPDMDILKW
jgi:ankyrin repeat protein